MSSLHYLMDINAGVECIIINLIMTNMNMAEILNTLYFFDGDMNNANFKIKICARRADACCCRFSVESSYSCMSVCASEIV